MKLPKSYFGKKLDSLNHGQMTRVTLSISLSPHYTSEIGDRTVPCRLGGVVGTLAYVPEGFSSAPRTLRQERLNLHSGVDHTRLHGGCFLKSDLEPLPDPSGPESETVTRPHDQKDTWFIVCGQVAFPKDFQGKVAHICHSLEESFHQPASQLDRSKKFVTKAHIGLLAREEYSLRIQPDDRIHISRPPIHVPRPFHGLTH
ncbi:hypothetical protein AVEN_76711-1 [Araneus ventricosus]|uniref:Uncharacterized protein n=1 Tax=Araneus ventricosus TaxID=182803 RepID=A0A4Y2BPX9_ARAVE|nr:hypothetical protein AVEN_76711-1 [Araneus ventricosus]